MKQADYTEEDLAQFLIRSRVPSRVHAEDTSLYDFAGTGVRPQNSFMGWAVLASNPPLALDVIQSFAQRFLQEGLRHVVLIGQGGSSQAPATFSQYRDETASSVAVTVLDAVYPELVRKACWAYPLEKSLFIVASKSGSTIEPRFVLQAVRAELAKRASFQDVSRRLVAITDAGSDLERQAREEGWLAVFNGEETVGGRFSALSVFGLLPAALMGVDINRALDCACEGERLYAQDSEDNPAVQLAAFLYANYQAGRDKCTLVLPEEGRMLGLWVEQLVAESLGKGGRGIVPLTETNPHLLKDGAAERCLITYELPASVQPSRAASKDAFLPALTAWAVESEGIPLLNYRIETVEDLLNHFLMWEYAVAFCACLMKVYPFDQPDVASAKAKVLEFLEQGRPELGFCDTLTLGQESCPCTVTLSPCLGTCSSAEEALSTLLASIKKGDYLSLNAFVPDDDPERRALLERMRAAMASFAGVPSCLEMGSRYLHSTGQLHKGGPNNGVYLIISADEENDIPLPSEAESLGELAKTQAMADFTILSQRQRRCVHVHLPLHDVESLRLFEGVLQRAMRKQEENHV